MKKPALDPEYAPEFFDLFGCPPPCPKDANPRIQTPQTDPNLHADQTPQNSLVEDLGEVADDLRQIHTDFGGRPYRVFSIVYEWTGGEVGRGDPQVLSEQEVLPTPKVDISGGEADMTAAGRKRGGSARLTEVSPRYTEDQLYALFPVRLSGAQRAFIEVRMDRRDGPDPIRRRYTLRRTPYRDPYKFQWVVPLYSQEEDRDRDTGEITQPEFYPARLNREGPPGANEGNG